MRSGTHARGDGSFGRSASTQTVKGAGLLALAVVIGAVLLHTAPRPTTVSTSTPVIHTTTTKAPKQAAVATPGPTSTTNPPARAPKDVHLLVANGTAVHNLGGSIRNQLSSSGYNTDKPAIDAPSKDHTSTAIYFQPGFETDALQLAATLSLNATNVFSMPNPPPVAPSALTGAPGAPADILVIAGTDIAPNSQTTPGATVAPGSTPTTASGGTTPPTTVHHTTTAPPTTVHTTTTAAHTTTTAHH